MEREKMATQGALKEEIEMSKTFKATLPYPPSVNTYWRFVPTHFKTARVLLSAKGRAYKAMVSTLIKRPKAPMKGELFVSMVCFPPDRRKRDFDNILKAPLDALGHVGIYEDDSQIVEFHYKKGTVIKGGKLDIEVREINDNQKQK